MKVKKLIDVIEGMQKLNDHLKKQKDKQGMKMLGEMLKRMDEAIADLEKS